MIKLIIGADVGERLGEVKWNLSAAGREKLFAHTEYSPLLPFQGGARTVFNWPIGPHWKINSLPGLFVS